MTTELAICRWDDDEFYFVSDDGERFYEVAPRPSCSADLDHLRPFGIVRSKTYPEGSMALISFARRWLAHSGDGRTAEFVELS